MLWSGAVAYCYINVAVERLIASLAIYFKVPLDLPQGQSFIVGFMLLNVIESDLMNISQAAKTVALTVKALRYYETIGLVVAAKRSDNGYREYSDDDIDQLHFIQRARANGFSLDECRELLAYYHDSARQSLHVKAMVMNKVAAVDAQIMELQQTRASLVSMAGACSGDENPQCAIINTLAAVDKESQ